MGDSDYNCKNKKWEENIYWSHFQSVKFFQILSGHYDLQLAIPQKFADNLREKLESSVSLKGPSGVIWDVALVEYGDKLYLKNGWKEFVKEHSLQENDLLVFKYNGNSQFDVLMFDGLSFCEKEASYFVRHCGHTEFTSGDKTNGAATPNIYLEMATNEGLHEVFEVTTREKPRKDNGTTTTPNSYHKTATNESSHEEFEVITRKKPRKEGLSVPKGIQANGKLRKRPKSKSSSSYVYRLQLKSNRRPVTEEEKDRAFQAASAASSGDSFMVIMQECHVYKGFFVTIPAEWARRHLPKKNIDVSLRVNKKTWLMRCYLRANSHGLAGAGWTNFSLENFLEKDDVCVFNLVGQSDISGVIFDVSIFRVVEEVVKPDKVTVTGASSRKGRQQAKRSQLAAS